jgi:hypothetical protein
MAVVIETHAFIEPTPANAKRYDGDEMPPETSSLGVIHREIMVEDLENDVHVPSYETLTSQQSAEQEEHKREIKEIKDTLNTLIGLITDSRIDVNAKSLITPQNSATATAIVASPVTDPQTSTSVSIDTSLLI